MTTDPTATRTWHPRLFAILWTWVAFRTVLPWLVFFRLTFEGSSYSWGSAYFGRTFYSSGLARPDFLLIYALLAVGILLLWLLREHRFRLGAPLLMVYLGFFAASAVHQFASGEPLIFQGDTLGLKVNVTAISLALNVGMLLLGLAWWWGARAFVRGPGARPLTGFRRTVVKVCVAFLPVQLPLLIFGEPHGLTDQIGVIGTLLQAILLAWAFFPVGRYR